MNNGTSPEVNFPQTAPENTAMPEASTTPNSQSTPPYSSSGTDFSASTGTIQDGASERMQRAEVAVDRAGEMVGRTIAQVGHLAMRFFVRAREEVEDVWSEAQHLSSQRTNSAKTHSPFVQDGDTSTTSTNGSTSTVTDAPATSESTEESVSSPSVF